MWKLPLNYTYPHRPEDALQLSAVLSHPDGKHWLADHYIDIYMHRDYIHEPWEGFFDADKCISCPFIRYHSMSRSALLDMQINLMDFLEYMLSDGNYIHCRVNKFYIPFFQEYNKEKSAHGAILCGYDKETGQFLLADFISGKFKQFACDRIALEKAIRHCNLDDVDKCDVYYGRELLQSHFDTISFYKVNSQISYIFNRELLVDSLQIYLESKRPQGIDFVPYGLYTSQLDWGISVLDKCIEVINQVGQIRVRPLYLMKIHKQIMQQRLQYLRDNWDIHNINDSLNTNSELMQRYTRLYLLALKYDNSSWSTERCDIMIQLIEEAKELEYRNTVRILSLM